MDCVAIGDSITVGVSPRLGCETRAVVGYPSGKIINLAGGKYHAICIFSAGSNDAKNPQLINNLQKIRDASNCSVRVWIRPIHSIPNQANKIIAERNGDLSVTFVPSRDRVHPRSYVELAETIKEELTKNR